MPKRLVIFLLALLTALTISLVAPKATAGAATVFNPPPAHVHKHHHKCRHVTSQEKSWCQLTHKYKKLAWYKNGEFKCLKLLWDRESGWNYLADNPSSGAYGIPQALPGSKMASAGADWATDPWTQMRWGYGYIKSTYKTPCGAWNHETAYGWYTVRPHKRS